VFADLIEVRRIRPGQEVELAPSTRSYEITDEGGQSTATLLQALEHMAQAEEVPGMAGPDCFQGRTLVGLQDVGPKINPELVERGIKRVVQFDRLLGAESVSKWDSHVVRNRDEDGRVVYSYYFERSVHDQPVNVVILD
jgi:hypothetical protein